MLVLESRALSLYDDQCLSSVGNVLRKAVPYIKVRKICLGQDLPKNSKIRLCEDLSSQMALGNHVSLRAGLVL